MQLRLCGCSGAAARVQDPMEAPQRFLDLYDPEVVPSQVQYAFSSVIGITSTFYWLLMDSSFSGSILHLTLRADEGLNNVTKALKAKNMWNQTLLVVRNSKHQFDFSE